MTNFLPCPWFVYLGFFCVYPRVHQRPASGSRVHASQRRLPPGPAARPVGGGIALQPLPASQGKGEREKGKETGKVYDNPVHAHIKASYLLTLPLVGRVH